MTLMQPDPKAQGGGRMQAFVASLLRQNDALVEAIDPEGLEVLAPPPVQHALELGELSRLGFGAVLPIGAQRVGLEGDWLARFGAMLGAQGRWARQVLMAPIRPPGDPEHLLRHDLVLDNATFRLLRAAPAWTRYLLLDFRISAVSDDKRDFMLRLGINLATGAVPDTVVAAFTPILEEQAFHVDQPNPALPDPALLPEMWDRQRLLDLVGRALPPRLNAALDPFVKGLRRRLGRDQDRLYTYHNDLHREAMRRASTWSADDARRHREEQHSAAIGREYRAKLDDLARQYATRVTFEWVQTLELVMPVQRFEVQIRRRKADRTLWLDWNPVVRRLEAPVCDATASMDRPRLVCDDALHLVVPAALGPCADCGRAFCRACHPTRCPKCGKP